MSLIYTGPAMVVGGDALLNADAMLVECNGWWGGFLKMRSVAGAEIVQESRERYVTVDGETPGEIITRRVHPDSPVLRVTGKGKVPFARKDAGKKSSTTS